MKKSIINISKNNLSLEQSDKKKWWFKNTINLKIAEIGKKKNIFFTRKLNFITYRLLIVHRQYNYCKTQINVAHIKRVVASV